ncbi:hypothetical protein LAZ67_21001744 [Cordylochernes scorpioides]|uniref:Mos1 transposase HTH domain-containing protein n=1 Tax=Cordylochernes scorpioides TaxID=51811 RepID=A0ABY6LP31_9ARAC|nr:hypothetical protein LAZ67_21001744 [Cordylochernes scorpioides]
MVQDQNEVKNQLLRFIVVHGDHALAERTCQKWFARFKSGNFDLEGEERPGASPSFEDEVLGASLEEDTTQMQKELAKTLGVTQPAIFHGLKEMGMLRKVENWVPYQLKRRDVERRLFHV